jgi:hypothetical protein
MKIVAQKRAEISRISTEQHQKTVDWNKVMEEHWGKPIAHESGHALIAVLMGVDCQGIYFEVNEGESGNFCALTPPFESETSSRNELLVLAAGTAAELISYPNQIPEGDGLDRKAFGELSPESFDDMVAAATNILTRDKRKLKRLISKCKERIRSVDYDLGALPSLPMDGSLKTYHPLVTREELIDAVRRP